MDNSQGSDFLSESTDKFCNSPADPTIMDAVTYDSLISSTKLAFSNIRNVIREPTFPAQFCTLLEDCGERISQSLCLITEILLDSDEDRVEVTSYMNNVVCLLQLLSDCIKKAIESVYMTCCNMKTFPMTIGHIICTVFKHCKDSELLYGSHLISVENQLKDLFRTCHDLQLIYLMVLEKHFIFDLTEREEQDILIQALHINSEIGDIVQCLDVKTMAEQWKGYTDICDKYSSSLMDTGIYNDCTKILCTMAENNLKIALQQNQEEKIIIRSLKVSRFTLNILLKICNIFKLTFEKDQTPVLELLLYICLNNEAYFEAVAQKTEQFKKLFNDHISSSAHTLLSELVADTYFVNCVYGYDINGRRSEEKTLGFIILVMTMIKALFQRNYGKTIQFQKLIDCIYTFLPHCHVWFNLGLKFKLGQLHTCSLYEHLLTHTLTLAATMTAYEFNTLETRMVEAILSTDCYSAKFSSNLWILIARMTSRKLLSNQVASLCKMYQTLEYNNRFADSPQQTQLAYTLSRLFQLMIYEDKMKIYNLYNINDDKNSTLWTVLRVSNLPKEVQSDAKEIVIGKFKMQFRKMFDENINIIMEIDDVIKIVNLASTCTFINSDVEMETLIMEGWTKACPRNIRRIAEVVNKRTAWYYKYVRGLVMITNSVEHIFHSNNGNLVKVLHVITEIIHSGSTEIKLLLIKILCKLANIHIQDMNKHISVPIITQIFSKLFRNEDIVVRNKLFNELRNHASYNLDRIISKVINEEDSLRKTWVHFEQHGTLNEDPTVDIRQHFEAVMDFKYSHKCIDNGEEFGQSVIVDLTKSTSNNFDFADIDTLFETESVSEPVSKKAKLNTDGVVDEIISRLEEDAAALSKVKENIMVPEYQKRIKKICNKLANMTEF